MATNFAVTLGLLWTPPSAAANSGSSTLQLQGAITGQNVGTIDIPATTVPATVIPVPFGAVSEAKLFAIKNMMSSDIGIRLNGHVTDDFQVPPGAMVLIAGSAAPQANPLASADIVIKATPSVIETVFFWVMGD